MSKEFWNNLKKPILALAPMDGYTNSAFRRTCKEVNPEIIVFTEFVSADGLAHRAKKLREKIAFDKSEKPIIVQLFGKNPETFITAAKYCESVGFDGIDINMGCPAKKVIKSEHGLALRRDPQTAYRIIEAVAKNTKLPVSVKTRLGWDGNDDLTKFAKGIENAGADLLTVHARFFKEVQFGPIDYSPLYELKKKISIPIIGNGSITSLEDGLNKLGNLDGIMVGRASFGNPWVFAENQPKNFSEKIPLIKKHVKYLIEAKGKKTAMFEIRKHLAAYIKSLPQASSYRARLVRVSQLNQINSILSEIAKQLEKN